MYTIIVSFQLVLILKNYNEFSETSSRNKIYQASKLRRNIRETDKKKIKGKKIQEEYMECLHYLHY